MSVSDRPETNGDEAFLRALMMATVAEELGAANWPEPMRTHLVALQYEARRQSVRSRFPEGESRILLAGGDPAGWLYAAMLPDVVWLVEIMVAADRRGKGIGARAVRRLCEAAGERPVRLNVNVTNVRAAALYERLGFRRIGGDEVQHVMEYRP